MQDKRAKEFVKSVIENNLPYSLPEIGEIFDTSSDLQDQWWTNYSIPKWLLSQNGPFFVNLQLQSFTVRAFFTSNAIGLY